MAAHTRYVALLRGINVGGKNLVKMAALRAAFESLALEDVSTYIASGNVLFRAPRQSRDELAARIERVLSDEFGIEQKIVLLTGTQLRRVVEDAPEGFGAPSHLNDVIFLRKPLTAAKAMSIVQLREGVDQAWVGKGVLYFSRLQAKASSSRLSKVVALPEYQNMTIRSWSTTTKLAALLDAR